MKGFSSLSPLRAALGDVGGREIKLPMMNQSAESIGKPVNDDLPLGTN